MGYDALDRLITVTATGNAAFNKTYAYDSFGNFKTKSDVDADEWVYGLKPGVASPYAGPHAVTQLKKAGAVVGQYAYDANGNQTSGTGRTVDYTSFNMPKRIATAASVVEFAYDAQHERIIQVKDGDMTLYMSPRWDTGTQFLKETKKDGTVEYQHHIYAASSPVAVYTVTVKNSVVTKKTRYFHKDNLGSVTAISGDVNGVFQVFERFSFEPFGARRQSGLFTNLTSIETKHGYTGHEMLDSVNLIHMNGRIYDAKIGRFLQADPTIQAPNNLQSYNRYSYVMNNPLSMTDPSGYSWLSKKWKKAWNHGLKQVVAIAAAAAISAAGCPVCAGAVAGYINTGTLKGALMGAAMAGVGQYASNWNIAARVAANGVAGGLASKAQGGTFTTGFTGSAFGAATSGWTPGGDGFGATMSRAAVGGLAGGVGSMLTGGSFRDGAVSGAIASLASGFGKSVGEGLKGPPPVMLASATTLIGPGTTVLDWMGAAGAVGGAELFGATVVAGVAVPNTNIQPDTLNHYTTAAGYAGITGNGGSIVSQDSVYLTPDVYTNGQEAQAGLALRQTPVGYFSVPIENVNVKSVGIVQPNYGQPGGGTEVLAQPPVSIQGATWHQF